ncbi:hypothetical protein ACH4ZX_21365 [Streptomyces sp. NPDC020490]|uniref:hypothetical protein n=1 Tax=Streptomyces sp. NPDC020490 TaxID=3365078 RepID=UPI00378C7610
MSDLKADTRRIRECSRALQRIHNSFTDRANPAEDFSPAEIGDQRIVDAFHEFADNWKIHRKDLAEKIEKLGVITWEAAKSYDAIDAKLAQALREQDARAGRGRGGK